MAAGFKLRLNGGATHDEITDVGLVYVHLYTSLLPSTTYGVEIAAYDSGGQMSDWSAPVYATTGAAPVLTVVVNSDGSPVITSSEGVVSDSSPTVVAVLR